MGKPEGANHIAAQRARNGRAEARQVKTVTELAKRVGHSGREKHQQKRQEDKESKKRRRQAMLSNKKRQLRLLSAEAAKALAKERLEEHEQLSQI